MRLVSCQRLKVYTSTPAASCSRAHPLKFRSGGAESCETASLNLSASYAVEATSRRPRTPPSPSPRPQANFIGALLLAAAYGFLNQPAPPQPVLREATIVNAEEATFFDVGLDDASIPFDDGITAARKCGFCMG